MALVSIKAFGADVPVHVANAKSKEIAPTRDFLGRVVSDNHISLSAEIDGKLVWMLPLGANIKKGDVLARIDDSLFHIAKDKAAEAVVEYESRLALAHKRSDRFDELSKHNYVEENRINILENEIAELTSLFRQAQLELDNRQALLQRTEIKAPFDGHITERLAKTGEWVSKAGPVLRIVDDSSLEVSIRVPSAFAAAVKVKDPVTIRSEVGIVAGQLKIKAVQPDFKYYELRVDFTDGELPTGMPVTVGFAMPGYKTTQIVVPVDALQVRNGSVGLFKVDENKMAVYVPVAPVALDSGWAAVEGQISDGDTLVIRGVERLAHGQTVKVLEPEVNLVLKD